MCVYGGEGGGEGGEGRDRRGGRGRERRSGCVCYPVILVFYTNLSYMNSMYHNIQDAEISLEITDDVGESAIRKELLTTSKPSCSTYMYLKIKGVCSLKALTGE